MCSRRKKLLFQWRRSKNPRSQPSLASCFPEQQEACRETLRGQRQETSLGGFKDGRALFSTNPVPGNASPNDVPPRHRFRTYHLSAGMGV